MRAGRVGDEPAKKAGGAGLLLLLLLLLLGKAEEGRGRWSLVELWVMMGGWLDCRLRFRDDIMAEERWRRKGRVMRGGGGREGL